MSDKTLNIYKGRSEKMKKSILRRILCMCLLATMMVNSTTLTSMAASDTAVMPIWDNTSTASTVLTFDGTTANCTTSIHGYSGVTEIYGTMILKRVSGSSETTVKSWAVSSSSRNLLASKSCTVTKGYKYKLQFNGYVSTDSYAEYVSVSSSATCK